MNRGTLAAAAIAVIAGERFPQARSISISNGLKSLFYFNSVKIHQVFVAV